MSDTGRHGHDRRSVVPSPRGTAVRAAPELRPAVRTLDPAELVWLAEARELLRGPGVDLTDIAWLGGHLDGLMTTWHHTMPSLRWDPLPTTTAVGLAVGDAVIARVPGLEWVFAFDAPGSPYALAHPRTAMVVVPADTVAMLWQHGATGRLPGLVDELAALSAEHVIEEHPRVSGAMRLLGRRR
ncbi:MAG TPA: DUF3806 domain-containing protein [Cellulomonas sp.]|uniref:DUF3806 domain-containing protein n=1 Tax=Cellulomonas sp. TaxID=40001 RepID=UPI002E33C0CB|nr:DUF3806 domain-containing protein [Cellulomonas sp.]HEX5332793.1 DUF3806 domain-containing protein [Cellulomonas sp.]